MGKKVVFLFKLFCKVVMLRAENLAFISIKISQMLKEFSADQANYIKNRKEFPFISVNEWKWISETRGTSTKEDNVWHILESLMRWHSNPSIKEVLIVKVVIAIYITFTIKYQQIVYFYTFVTKSRLTSKMTELIHHY